MILLLLKIALMLTEGESVSVSGKTYTGLCLSFRTVDGTLLSFTFSETKPPKSKKKKRDASSV